MSYEKELIDKIFAMGLIPMYRFKEFKNYSQKEYFYSFHNEEIKKFFDKENIIGCFSSMFGCPIEPFYVGRGIGNEPLYIGGIVPNAIIYCQSIDDSDNNDDCYSNTNWQKMTAYDFMIQCIEHGKIKGDDIYAHWTLKNQCIVNSNDIKYIEEIKQLLLLEDVEELKYKIRSNLSIFYHIVNNIEKEINNFVYDDSFIENLENNNISDMVLW